MYVRVHSGYVFWINQYCPHTMPTSTCFITKVQMSMHTCNTALPSRSRVNLYAKIIITCKFCVFCLKLFAICTVHNITNEKSAALFPLFRCCSQQLKHISVSCTIALEITHCQNSTSVGFTGMNFFQRGVNPATVV